MNDRPELDKRKAFSLATVVYEYINTAEPVGSVTLTQKYNLGVSSATIRNEMAELEASGYLVQPHTSAGRVPSDAGYRTYVDRLMAPETLTKDDSRRIRDQFREASPELAGVSAEIADAVRTIFATARQTAEPEIAAAGAQNLLDQPEFHDLRKLRAILRIVEEQRTLYDLIADELTPESATAASGAAHVRIGHELRADELAECSVVTVPYRFGDRGVGMLAILGPRRMPYARLIALASGTARSLGEHLNDVEIR